jgi:hypothetical protein
MRRALLLSLVLALPAVPARADPIFISEGFLDIVIGESGLGFGTMIIRGTQGFILSTNAEITNGFGVCNPCSAGNPTPLGGAFSEFFNGSFEINGETFAFPSPNADAGLFFVAPTVKTPPLSDQAFLSAPFDFSRSAVVTVDAQGQPTVHQLIGRGGATVQLAGLPSGSPEFWRLERAHFEFATATPEPGTILLLGSGAVGLVFRVRRGRARS